MKGSQIIKVGVQNGQSTDGCLRAASRCLDLGTGETLSSHLYQVFMISNS